MTPLNEYHPVAEVATYTTHNEQNGETSMISAGYEPAIPAIKRPQTYALDGRATGIGVYFYHKCIFNQLSITQQKANCKPFLATRFGSILELKLIARKGLELAICCV
jgi:hypothetical protein